MKRPTVEDRAGRYAQKHGGGVKYLSREKLAAAWLAGRRSEKADAKRNARYPLSVIVGSKGGPIGVALEIERAANAELRRELREARAALLAVDPAVRYRLSYCGRTVVDNIATRAEAEALKNKRSEFYSCSLNEYAVSEYKI